MADTRIDELRRRLERDPASRLFAQLAEELRKIGDLGQAINVARAGLAVHASYPSARLTLGRALLDLGDATGARAELESALREAPDNIQASRHLAQAREQLGDLKGAAEQYRRTLLMSPDDRQLQAALEAVEARLGGPVAESTLSAETRPPATRPAPPPLPGRATFAPPRAAVMPAAEAVYGTSRERGALPPVVMRIPVAQAEVPLAPALPPLPVTAAPPGPGTLVGTETTEVAAAPPTEVHAESASASTTPFSSSTLAELYFQQGLLDRAADVYRQLLEQEPDNEKAQKRLAELERGAPAADDRAARRRTLERTIAGLETLLGAVRRR